MIPNAQRSPWFLMSGFLIKRLGPDVVLFAGVCACVCVWMGVCVAWTGEIEGRVGGERGREVVNHSFQRTN